VVTRVTAARARFAARVRDPAKFVLASLRANGGTNCVFQRIANSARKAEYAMLNRRACGIARASQRRRDNATRIDI
jgi:hypothetical protein